MINILPPKNKAAVQKEYYGRLGVVFLAACCGVLLVVLFGLMPSFVASKNRENLENANFSLRSNTAAAKNQALFRAEVQKVKSELVLLGSLYPSLSVRQALDIVTSVKPAAISLSGISVEIPTASAASGQLEHIALSGIAKSREDLALYAKRLTDRSEFSKVTFPLSDLAKPKDGEFSILITVNSGMR